MHAFYPGWYQRFVSSFPKMFYHGLPIRLLTIFHSLHCAPRNVGVILEFWQVIWLAIYAVLFVTIPIGLRWDAHRCSWGIRSFGPGGSRNASSLWCFAADRSLGVARHLDDMRCCLEKPVQRMLFVMFGEFDMRGWGERNHSILVSNSLSRNPCVDASPDFEESSGYGRILWRCARIWVGLFILIWIEMWNNAKAWLNFYEVQGDD